jgi:hypothetical protein
MTSSKVLSRYVHYTHWRTQRGGRGGRGPPRILGKNLKTHLLENKPKAQHRPTGNSSSSPRARPRVCPPPPPPGTSPPVAPPSLSLNPLASPPSPSIRRPPLPLPQSVGVRPPLPLPQSAGVRPPPPTSGLRRPPVICR